MNAESVLY